MLAVAGTIAAIESPPPSRLRPATRPLPEELPPAAVGTQATAPGLTASERVAQLAEQGLSEIQRERYVTLAVTETKEGLRVISSNTKKPQESVAQLLQSGEVAGAGRGHAEIAGVEAAMALGLSPTGVAASRPICPSCAEYLRSRGVVPLSALRR
jgi:tRNA(Ile2) C34 agmatinyltransferase TiaS